MLIVSSIICMESLERFFILEIRFLLKRKKCSFIAMIKEFFPTNMSVFRNCRWQQSMIRKRRRK